MAWLDSAGLHARTGRFSMLAWDPWLIVSSQPRPVGLDPDHCAWLQADPDDPLRTVHRVLRAYPGPRYSHLLPVGPGWIACLSYELNRSLERLPPPKPTALSTPTLLLMGMRMVVVREHGSDRSWWASLVEPDRGHDQNAVHAARERLARALSLADEAERLQTAEPAPGHGPLHLEPTMTPRQYEQMVLDAQEFIRAGDIFQANLAQQFTAMWNGSAWSLYQTLRALNPSPFACFVQSPLCSLVSCSPERLVRVWGGVASTRPIAGTRPRGSDPDDDAIQSLELLLSDKERAEHIMLVDLARNDLGRVCRAGSVRVDELMSLEHYSHVIHIVSDVEGRLRDGVDAVEVIRAMFPGGTITGCPKVRCMQILHELEPVGRGLYTGSCGYVGFDGSLDLNILIRTMIVQQGRVSFHVGAGIVADSIPEREYAETLAKAQALIAALQTAGVRAPSHAHRA